MSLATLEQAESQALELSRQGNHRAANEVLLAAAEEAIRLAQFASELSQRQQFVELSDEYLRLASDLKVRRLASKRQLTPERSSRRPRRAEMVQGESGAGRQWQVAERPAITLADVAGMADLKHLVRREIVDPIRYPEIDDVLNIPYGFGVLLYGPPGTGKTYFARALAGELDCAFFVIDPAQILSKWVGESEQRLAALMTQAKAEPRAVVYIDEIAEMFPRRGTGSVYSDRLVGVFLQQLDGFDQSENMLLTIGATNHPLRIDRTLIRSGRLGHHVYVGLPDVETRRQILEIEMKAVPLDNDADLDALADATDGYSSADVAAVAREARKQTRDRIVRQRHSNNGNGKDDIEVKVTAGDLAAALDAVRPAKPDLLMLAEIEEFRRGRS